MQNFLLILLVLLSLWLLGRLVKHRSLYPFLPMRFNFGKRRDTFRHVLQLLDERHAKVLVETGTAREGLGGAKSNGASTVVFGLWAKQNGATLHSVDISAESISAARAEVEKNGLADTVHFYQQDSIQFLKDFSGRVDFLYLDSYDYDKEDPAIQKASQEHHLAEFQAIEGQLHDNTFVLIDDCDLPNGGKGKLAVEYMLRNGWRVLENAYQVLLARASS